MTGIVSQVDTVVPARLGPVNMPAAGEASCREMLRKYLASFNQWNIEKNIEEMMSLQSGTCERFQYFCSKTPKSVLEKLLVSGCCAGSEMIIARNQFGFQEIVGTDVEEEYAAIARERLKDHPGFEVTVYDGEHLPYRDASFTAVVSGHIIEHTRSPFNYLREHVRVLAPGGFMFLEFPDRYHPIELHTNLPSAEHLSWPWRNLVLYYRSTRFSSFTPDERDRYKRVLRDLKPISVPLVEKWLKAIDAKHCRVMHHYEPAPGFMRLIIQKD